MAYRVIQAFKAPLTKKDKKAGRHTGPVFVAGQIVSEDNEWVKKYPQFFGDVDEYAELVEQASAAPGEIRLVKPQKKADEPVE